MAQMRESRDLARSIRRHAKGMVGAHTRQIVKGLVVDVGPLSVELASSDIVIEDEHLLLGSWLRFYDNRYGLQPDDTVLMVPLDDGDWFLVDVVSREKFDLGDDPEHGTTLIYNTGSGKVVAQVPYLDADGTVLGQILLYDKTTLRNFAGHTSTSVPVSPDAP